MSRWLGLREDQCLREHLAVRIAGLFPPAAYRQPRRPIGPCKEREVVAGAGRVASYSPRFTD